MTLGRPRGRLRWAWGTLRTQRLDLVVGGSLACVHQACEALVAVVIGAVIDQGVVTGDLGRLLDWLAVLVLIFVALATSAALGYYRLGRASLRTAHTLRTRVVERVVAPDAANVSAGVALSMATSDSERVGELGQVLGGLASAMVALGVGAVVLFAGAWQLGLVVFAGLPIVVVGAQRMADPLAARSEREQESVADASETAVDLVRGLRVLKGIGGERAGAARFARLSQRTRAARVHAARWAGLHYGVTSGVGGLFVVVIAWWGGRLALQGDLSIGQLVAAVGLAQFLVGPLERLLSVTTELSVVRASAGRLMTLLDTPESMPRLQAAPTGSASLTLENVTVGGLAALDVRVADGEWLGIAVERPGDAASLLDVLARRARPDSGRLLVSGQDAAVVDSALLRRWLVVADHDAVLFDGTVDDNVAAARDPAVDLAAVSAATGVDEVLAAQSRADVRVGESGRFLSGGQRQRVALGRAVATGAPVLVLHEPTTAIDSVTEVAIAREVRALRAARTTVVVSNSPAWLAVCDRVLVVRDGRVTAADTHETLSESTPYRALVMS